VKGPDEALKAIGLTMQKVVGGSSGALYGLLFLRAANSLGASEQGTAAAWASAALNGCEAVSEVGQAKLGDRTMLDALWPFAAAFAGGLREGKAVADALEKGIQAAEAGARATAEMTAKRGRSSYLGERALGYSDPGAAAVAIWLRAVGDSLRE
jgi:triose/dihydroxyacetone kinase / FAD-AMP lyase (cyclizing)